MLFNSNTFILFFLVVLIIYYSSNGWTFRKATLLVASYIFYAAWNPPFIILLWLSTVLDWFVSKRIYASTDKHKKRYWLYISLLVNLGLLAFFKYGNFVIDNVNFLFNGSLKVDHYSIILPVGISFYTFQTLSYSLDIYKGNAKPWSSFLDYALYVTFFPQLVAGPIVRSDGFLDQCITPKKFNLDEIGYGLFWVITGLLLKIVVSDYFLAPVVEVVFSTNGKVNFLSAWSGTLAFTGQILCDFSGYSIAAIGVAKMLGFQLPKNFKFPYAASGFSDFWKRWHISLSTWLRDYLYIPLGGNRQGSIRTQQNLMATMLIGGLWHGASWTFVVWGGLHGAYLIAERQLRKKIDLTRIPEVIKILGVFFLTCLTWVFFRATSFNQAGNLIISMFGFPNGKPVLANKQLAIVFFITGAMLLVNYVFRHTDLEIKIQKMKWWQVSLIVSSFLYLIITLSGSDRSFIYFQF